MTPRPRPPRERFEEKVDRSGGPDACHLWQACVGRDGYGQFSLGSSDANTSRHVPAHQWAYEQANGEIPADERGRKLPLDHLCHNEAVDHGDCDGGACVHRRCVNLSHLALRRTHGENTRASALTIVARNAAKTHCINGHALTDDNVYVTPAGARQCRRCRRDREAVYRSQGWNRKR